MIDEWMVNGIDLNNYLQACKDADLSNFKQDRRLTKIFEHATIAQAFDYLQLIERQTPNLFENKFTNDNYGSPDIKNFHGRKYSPSTIQYIGVLSNLIYHFGTLSDLRIVEIGGGYGGQCRTIMDVFEPACYHIIDLPEVCKLQRRYCKAECFSAPTKQQYDLCISNYALSEINNNETYINDVVLKSKHGYITCNTNFVELPIEHKKLPDIPNERKENYILIW